MQLSLAEIKKIAFETLKYFKSFCDEKDIRFYLSNGTLLGAIKYNGFIPWDDDIDVFIPREDYNKLIREFKDNAQYKLFSIERENNYKFTFAKLCDITTIKVENNIDNGVQLGIDIDIFPLDCCTSHLLSPFVQKRIQIYQIGCILSKFVSSQGRPFYKKILINYCKIRGFEYFCKKLTNVINKESSKGNDYMGCLMWPIYGKREVIPSKVFSSTISVEFEGEKFLAPVGYDLYLRSLYGDYEKDPPMEKQQSHHKYTAYRL